MSRTWWLLLSRAGLPWTFHRQRKLTRTRQQLESLLTQNPHRAIPGPTSSPLCLCVQDCLPLGVRPMLLVCLMPRIRYIVVSIACTKYGAARVHTAVVITMATTWIHPMTKLRPKSAMEYGVFYL